MAEMLRNPDTTVAASRHYFRKLVLVMSSMALSAGLLWSAARGTDPEKEMAAAIHREVVLGDLPGAMEQYRHILAQPGVPPPLAARALLQTGECLEKLGQGKDA